MNQTTIRTVQKQQRVVFIELLRIIAAFLVIVNHTNSQIFKGSDPSFTWFASLSYFYVCKIAVPVFVMITGYIMLDRKSTYKKMLSGLLRTAVCLVVFSAVYYIADYISGERSSLNPVEFLLLIMEQPITNAFWYLYLYLGILLMIPFLQKLAAGMEKRDYHAFFIISGLLISLWPIVTHYIPQLTYPEHLELPLFNGYICLLLLGSYVKRFCGPSVQGKYLCFAIFLLLTGLNVGLTYLEYLRNPGGKYLFLDNRLFLPIVAAGFCMFYFAFALNYGERTGKWIRGLGGLTFGIYLLSDLFIDLLEPVYVDMLSAGIHVLLAMVIYEVLIFAAAALVTLVLKQIPLIKKLL